MVKYFKDQHLLHTTVQCQPCGWWYSLIKKKGSVTSYQFRCLGCRKKSMSKDSFFDGWHLPLLKVFRLMYFWLLKMSCSESTYHTSMLNATTVHWYQYFRDICSWKQSSNHWCPCVHVSYTYIGHSDSVPGTTAPHCGCGGIELRVATHPVFAGTSRFLAPAFRSNPGRDASCLVFSVITVCCVHVMQPGMKMCGILHFHRN